MQNIVCTVYWCLYWLSEASCCSDWTICDHWTICCNFWIMFVLLYFYIIHAVHCISFSLSATVL